ncbi:DNA-directed RNA polymerase II subunit RPB1-like [Macrosteles quadrilineatus]|uniref:DNA-directed RNA polymerase II subunit RPB1-like n=1 Tax=Macrosteles quadrilineatus TaxID=74068 RepID=UPI0023E329C2|nr:DNA-directed RNA polymerase II subunit RPB1-like [Macrosteles quadrilineatus]
MNSQNFSVSSNVSQSADGQYVSEVKVSGRGIEDTFQLAGNVGGSEVTTTGEAFLVGDPTKHATVLFSDEPYTVYVINPDSSYKKSYSPRYGGVRSMAIQLTDPERDEVKRKMMAFRERSVRMFQDITENNRQLQQWIQNQAINETQGLGGHLPGSGLQPYRPILPPAPPSPLFYNNHTQLLSNYVSRLSDYSRQLPRYIPQVPSYYPQSYGYTPQTYGYNSLLPSNNPQSVRYNPQSYGYTPQTYGYNSQLPSNNPQSVRYNPQSYGYTPQSYGYNSLLPSNNPQSVRYNPQSYGYNPQYYGYNPLSPGSQQQGGINPASSTYPYPTSSKSLSDCRCCTSNYYLNN